MTAHIEVVSTGGGVPEGQVSADAGGVLADEFRNGGLGMHARVTSQKVDGKGHEKEMGLLWVGSDEGTPKKSYLKNVLAEVVSQFRMERMWVGKENGSKGI